MENTAYDDRYQRIEARLAEIEQAIKDGFCVEDRENNENIYMVGADFKEGEYISVAKYDVAAMFVDDSELYEPWKNAYLEYLKNKSDARQLFRERAGGLFGKKN